jgi:hypothetical protein
MAVIKYTKGDEIATEVPGTPLCGNDEGGGRSSKAVDTAFLGGCEA